MGRGLGSASRGLDVVADYMPRKCITAHDSNAPADTTSLYPDLQRFWGNAKARQRIMEEIDAAFMMLSSAKPGSKDEKRAIADITYLCGAVDAFTAETLTAHGYPQQKDLKLFISLKPGSLRHRYHLQKGQPASIHISMEMLHIYVSIGDPDFNYLSWLHERLHARRNREGRHVTNKRLALMATYPGFEAGRCHSAPVGPKAKVEHL
jgi:hypothetical protein